MPAFSLQHFFALMLETVAVRRRITATILGQTKVASADADSLQRALDHINALPRHGNRVVLQLSDDAQIEMDPDYEVDELNRDIIFINQGEDALIHAIATRTPNLERQMALLGEKLRGVKVRNWVTDRDGTVNNYCGRYLSSVQSVYNAVFLTRFARTVTGASIILTAAPLDRGGVSDISLTSSADLILAGSKGREFLDSSGQRHALPIPAEHQRILDRLNGSLEQLLKDPRYGRFALTGSGFQRKFGQTTIARQDISNSIPREESERFLRIVKECVRTIDPQGSFLGIEDTGKDIEIILTVDTHSSAREFNKGDGVSFLAAALSLNMGAGPNLVCGDTASDIPMFAALAGHECDTFGVMVTTDMSLLDRARDTGAEVTGVDTPDVLVCGLNELSR